MVWRCVPFSGRCAEVCELIKVDTSPHAARRKAAFTFPSELKEQSIDFLAALVGFVSHDMRAHYSYSPLVGRCDNQLLLNGCNDHVQYARHWVSSFLREGQRYSSRADQQEGHVGATEWIEGAGA